MARSKKYDRAYFERWYRDRRHAIASGGELHRQVAFAVAITERLLARPLRSVLDAAAGEGRWHPVLQQLRPKVRYIGFDTSEWAVAKWGRRRNLHLGSLETLDQLDLDGPFDLVVVSDVFHYLKAPALRASLAALVPLIGGVAFLPTFTIEDEIEGDMNGFQLRRAATYRRYFREAGLFSLGMHAWATKKEQLLLSRLERPA